MTDHVYKKIEIVGSSKESAEAAIRNALTKAGKTIQKMRWFEVVDTRGYIEDEKVSYYQVTLKIGFQVE